MVRVEGDDEPFLGGLSCTGRYFLVKQGKLLFEKCLTSPFFPYTHFKNSNIRICRTQLKNKYCKDFYLNFGPGYLTGFGGLEVAISQMDPAPFVSIHQVLKHPGMACLGEVDEGIAFVVVPPNKSSNKV